MGGKGSNTTQNSLRVFIRTECQQNVNIFEPIKVLLGVVQKKKSIYTNEQKMMYDLLWGSNKASELFADCSSLKGLIIKYYSNFWTRIPVTLIWNHPFLLNTHILPHLPMDENFCRVLKLKIFPRGAAVLAPLIFGIFLGGRGMDYF